MNFPTRLRASTQRLLSIAVAGLLAATGLTIAVAPSSQAAAMPAASWSVSNNQAGAAGTTYTYDFTTATAGTIKTVTFAVSGAGLAGTPGIAREYGLGAGAVSISGQTVTYTVTTPASVGAGIRLYFEISGLTNQAAGTYTTSITTNDATPAVIDGPTATPAVTLSSSNTAVNATLAKSLTFSSSATSLQLALDPGLPSLSDQTASFALSISTNASSGYTLSVSDTSAGLRSSSAGLPAIAPVSSGKATSVAWPGASYYGYKVLSGGTATIDPAFTGGKYAGYTNTGEIVASRPNPTTGDSISVFNRVAIDYGTPASDYTDTITYTVTPNYG